MFENVDIDQATLALMRANHDKLVDLQGRAAAATGEEEWRLFSEAVAVARRQYALVSEVPGLEEYARRMASLIGQVEQESN